jgi:hypothetical protein
MRANLNKPTAAASTSETMSSQLQQDNSKAAKDLFSTCELCKRKVLKVLFSQHSDMCTKMDGKVPPSVKVIQPVFDLELDEEVMMTTFKPQPPRNCR